MATASLPPLSQRASATPWILDSWRDLLLIVATPLVVLAAISSAKLRWSGDEITTFALICAIGHHLPGMMRAYFDRQLFERYRARFIIAPLFLIAVAATAMVWELKGVILVAAVWGWWHYMAQAYGFMRIYDGKVGSSGTLTRWLDKAMCVTWFAAPVVLARNSLPVFLDLYYKSGGPPVPAGLVRGMQLTAVVLLAGVTVLFLVHAVYSYSLGRPPSVVKLLLMASTFGFYWYSLATVENVLVSYALFELFHDIQYLTIVWVFNCGRAERDPAAGGFTRFLFRKRGWLVGLYVALVLAYGSLDYGVRRIDSGMVKQALLGIFLASTLLHYYYDGFIWKLRENLIRQPLGLQQSVAGNVSPRWGRPAWNQLGWWGMFVTPIVFLSVLQLRGGVTDEARWAAIAQVVPDNALVHFNLGTALEENNKLDAAVQEYRRALEIYPNYDKAHYNLAGLMNRRGNSTEAIIHYVKATRLRPYYASAHNNLGSLHLQQQNYVGAVGDFERALACEPGNPGFALNLALASFHWGRQLAAAGDTEQAQAQFQRALRLKPRDPALVREIEAARVRLTERAAPGASRSGHRLTQE